LVVRSSTSLLLVPRLVVRSSTSLLLEPRSVVHSSTSPLLVVHLWAVCSTMRLLGLMSAAMTEDWVKM
jgi:hypothetical protein